MDSLLRILHLEDDPLDSEHVLDTLLHDGLPAQIDRVATMADFTAALNSNRYHLILSDFTLPGMDAHEAFDLARQACPEIPFIFVSGTLAEDMAIEMLKQGASDYVLKQRIQRLVPAVRRALKECAERAARKGVEESLRESERRFRGTFENAAVGIAHLDLEGHWLRVNQNLCDLLRYSKRELVGRHFSEITHPDDLEPDQSQFSRLVRGELSNYDVEKRYISKNGEAVWVEVTRSLQHDDSGRPLYSISIVQDITRRKAAEESLQESEQRLRATFDNAAVGIIEVEGDDDRCAVVNDRACEILGYTREELLRMTVHELTYPEDRPLSDRLNAQLHEGLQDTIQYEKRYLRRDGSPLWVHVAVSAVRDSQGRFLRSIGTVEDISERKRAEEEVRSMAEFPAENPYPVLRIASDGTVLYTNRPAIELLEPMGWMAGVRLSGAFLEHVQRSVALGGRQEFDLECAEGRVFAFVVAPSKRDGQFNLYGRDVTDRRRNEEVLRESESFYRQTLESIPGMVFTTRPDGYCDYQSQQWVEYTGVPVREHLGGGWNTLLHPDDRPGAFAAWRAAVEGGAPYDLEYRVRRHDGQYEWFKVIGRPIHDAAGKVVRWFGVALNIEDIKRVEAALRRSEDRLRLALAASKMGWWHWDFVNNLVDGDEMAKTLFGLEPDKPVASFDAALIHVFPDDVDRVRDHAVKSNATPGEHEIEFRVQRADGSLRWLLVKGRTMTNSDGAPIGSMGIAMDITNRKRAEEALEAARDAADRSKTAAEQANRAKDHFLAVLSHELRTPLTPVLMGVSLLQSREDLPGNVQETLEMVRHNVEMEARLIDDLLDMTRIVRGKVELQKRPIELCRVIGHAVEACRADIEGRGLEFGVDIGPSAPYWIEADPGRLQQVFWNLLKNSIKFTPQGGCVGIRCRPDDSGHVVAEVNDSGIGIDPQALPRLFDAFEQAERSITRQFGGLGLGLSISKALVEMHGGRIEARSDGKGKGASFRVRLPMTVPAGAPTCPDPRDDVRVKVRPLRILLVEDHGVTAKMIKMVLVMQGHEVETAGDVATALHKALGNEFDLLISDLGLPDGSGHDLMRQLRQRGGKMPGIALSGYGQEEDVRRSYEVGFTAHLIKPASKDAIQTAVASAARHAGG